MRTIFASTMLSEILFIFGMPCSNFFSLQACLGASAKEGERNVVQVTTENDEGEEVTHTILSMRVGLNEQVSSTETDRHDYIDIIG